MTRFLAVGFTSLVVTLASWAGYETITAPDGAPVSVVGGSTVRGQLYRVAPDGRSYPAPGMATRLNHPQYGPSSYAYSGSDGMYYLYNVPDGQFVLEIWLTQHIEHALRFTLIVRGQTFTDVAPIRVP